MSEYQYKFEQVLDYIDENLQQPLTVAQLSAIAGFSTRCSQTHFQRLFKAMFNIELFDYIHLLRDLQAVFELAYRPKMTMTEIALNASYQSPKAFCEAFKARNGLTPTEFRQAPQWSAWFEKQQSLDNMRSQALSSSAKVFEVSVVILPSIDLAVLEHQGPQGTVHASLQTFIAWRRALHTPASESRTFNLIYDDPNLVRPADYRFDIAAEIDRPLQHHDIGIVSKQIPLGRYALLAHTGNEPSLTEAIKYMYGQWLVNSGEQLADFPLLLERIALFPDVAQHKAMTNIYLPLESL